MPGQGRKPLPPPDSAELRRLVEVEHLSIPDLSIRYGCSRTPVLRWLKTLGISMPTPDYEQKPLADCWIWGGAKDPNGYGMKYVGGGNKMVGVHRLAWEWVHGPIPAGMVVMHTCDNPPCCNPDHLELGTHHANALDMKAKRRVGGSKTHCRRGHPITDESIYYHTQSGGKRVRRCRECDKQRLAVYRRSAKKDLPPDVEAFVFLAKYSELTQAQLAEHYMVSKAVIGNWCRDYSVKSGGRRGRGMRSKPSSSPALVPIDG